jgi:ABC-2 type transport system permease protein
VAMFWYAPVAGYLILVSAWARRNVFLWATLPPVFAVLVERLASGTHYVSNLIAYRTWGIWNALNLEHIMKSTAGHSHDSIVSLPGVFDTLNIAKPFVNVDLWLGVAVAVGFAFAAARIRRYRDDT